VRRTQPPPEVDFEEKLIFSVSKTDFLLSELICDVDHHLHVRTYSYQSSRVITCEM